MQCEKCAGSMEARTLFRLSGCLVAGGYGLLVFSAVALLLGVLTMVVGPRATKRAVSAHDARAKADALRALETIPGLPRGLAAELEANGKISEETLTTMLFDQQSRVRRILIDYHSNRAVHGVAGLTTAGVGGFVALVLLGFGIPAGIVGLLLFRRRKVWRCTACGFAFERT